MSIQLAELAMVVEQLAGSPDPGAWWCDRIHEATASATRGIWRVQGRRWSAVLKVVGHGEGGHPNWRSGLSPGHWYYWRREVLAYEVGLTSSFGGSARAPRCLLAAERDDGSVALWLEDLAGMAPATTWSPARYGLACRHLGRAQGAFATGRHLPTYEWLAHDWLRAYLAQRDADMVLLQDRDAWATPLAMRHLPERLAGPLLALRADQELFLGALERTPPTLCHLDLHPANLFGTVDETVLVDWSFVGIGAVGEDPGNLVADSVLDFHVRPEEIDVLYDSVARGYVAGLRDVGWDGAVEIVHLAMSATIAAKYAWIGPAMLRAGLEHRGALNGRPIDEAFARWASVVPFLLRRADEARRFVGAPR